MLIDEPVYVLKPGTDVFEIQGQLSEVRLKQKSGFVNQLITLLARLYDDMVLTIFDDVKVRFPDFVRNSLEKSETDLLLKSSHLSASLRFVKNFDGSLIMRPMGFDDSAVTALADLPFIDHAMSSEEKDIFEDFISTKTLEENNPGWLTYALFSTVEIYELISFEYIREHQNWATLPYFSNRITTALMKNYAFFLAAVENYSLSTTDASQYSYDLHNIEGLPFSALHGQHLTIWRQILEKKALRSPLSL